MEAERFLKINEEIAALDATLDDDAISASNENDQNAENVKSMMVTNPKTTTTTCCCKILKSMLNSDSQQSINAIVNNIINKPQIISPKDLYAAFDVVDNSITVLDHFTKNHLPSNLPVQIIKKEFPSIVNVAKSYASMYSKIKSIECQLKKINEYKCNVCLR